MPELLRASHIMPWREADNRQRLDPSNGFLPCANLDALFDKYLISFSDDGKLLISDRLAVEERRLLGLTEDKRIELVDEQKVYLKHHRANERKRSLGSPGR